MRGSFFGDFLNAWDKFGTDIDEYRELDGERVLVLVRWSGRGKTSGLELGETRSKGAFLFQVRDDKVTKLVCFFDGERAFADFGLLPGDHAAASAWRRGVRAEFGAARDSTKIGHTPRVSGAFDSPDLLGGAAGEGPFRPPPAGVMGVMGFFSLSGPRSVLAQSRAT
jgi:hypothetical protein